MGSDPDSDRALGIALALLRARNRFSNEISEKLAERDLPERAIADCLDYLVHKRLVDDDRLCREIVQNAVENKVWAPVRIRSFLERRGAPAEAIERALSLAPSESDLLQRALAKLGSKLNGPKLARRLISEGYSEEAVTAALSRLI
jgi:SOS response regulatory protein OraA/RecX